MPSPKSSSNRSIGTSSSSLCAVSFACQSIRSCNRFNPNMNAYFLSLYKGGQLKHVKSWNKKDSIRERGACRDISRLVTPIYQTPSPHPKNHHCSTFHSYSSPYLAHFNTLAIYPTSIVRILLDAL